MPLSTYLPEHMGSAVLSDPGPFVAGSLVDFTFLYTAGKFGIDDTGILKVSWRTTSDMGKPQFNEPAEPNFTTVEASNGALLECRFDRQNIRPWANTLVIRVARGFLRAADTITVRFGDRRRGSPGYRLQTNCENRFELKTCVDAFATYEFTEICVSPGFALVPGPVAQWRMIAPTLAVAGEPFRLAIVPEDLWGNPTGEAEALLFLAPSSVVRGLPETVRLAPGQDSLVLEGLIAESEGDFLIRGLERAGHEVARSNPIRVVPSTLRRQFWGDLHGQSGETVGTGSAESYFCFARDKAFLDIVGHQGNDFQITDAFWRELNQLTAAFDVPGRFVAVPGYEWSGNTGVGGDRNVFYRDEGRPIHRSSRILVEGASKAETECHTAHDLFRALDGEDCVVIAHVGGRYADVHFAHSLVERSVEVHSTWGTFEWLLHDAFAEGLCVGVVCHSDDHKGRPGAARPGASTFGAIGGLTCYQMPHLSRAALFDALCHRHHYGTTGTRLFMDVRASFERPVTVFSDDPRFGPAAETKVSEATMGDIIRPGRVPMRLQAEVVGSAPIESVDVLHGPVIARTVRPYTASNLGSRVRVMWQGSECRGRGRETKWQGRVSLAGNRIRHFEPVNFLNPEVRPRPDTMMTGLEWVSVTTGNRAGLDIWLEYAWVGTLAIETNLVAGAVDLSSLLDQETTFDAGGLDRKLRVYRLPETDWSRTVTLDHTVVFHGGADLPVYIRVTQADGHQAWSSPIYLIDEDR